MACDYFPDEMWSVASWLSRVHAEVSVPGRPRSGKTELLVRIC